MKCTVHSRESAQTGYVTISKPISFPESSFPLTVGKRELWEQPFQACAIDADCAVKPDRQNSVILLNRFNFFGGTTSNHIFPRAAHSNQHMAVCGLSLHQGSTESRKTLEQKFIFQIGTLNPNGSNERFSFN